MYQTHTSVDLVAACAGFPYGLVDATRILQEVQRPILLVCAEKFSDKVGSVRTSRMIFGDAAAALVLAPAPAGHRGDLDVLQTYASGPVSEVNAIIWPNADRFAARPVTSVTSELRSLSSDEIASAL